MSNEHSRMDMSPEMGELFGALAKAQAKIEGATKSATNPHLKSRYANLADVWTACRSALPEFGLCVLQTTQESGTAGVTVVTTLGHSSGQWMRGTLYMPASKPDAQGFGSAITYARRFALAAIVGVSPEDDDGQAASGAPKREHGPIKPPAMTAAEQATALPAQLSASVEIMAFAAKIKAAFLRAQTIGALNEEWLAFQDVKSGWPKSAVEDVTRAKDARKLQLASANKGAAAE